MLPNPRVSAHEEPNTHTHTHTHTARTGARTLRTPAPACPRLLAEGTPGGNGAERAWTGARRTLAHEMGHTPLAKGHAAWTQRKFLQRTPLTISIFQETHLELLVRVRRVGSVDTQHVGQGACHQAAHLLLGTRGVSQSCQQICAQIDNVSGSKGRRGARINTQPCTGCGRVSLCFGS